MKTDYPNIKYTVAPAARRAARQGTLSFTNCWGIAAKSKNQAAAIDFVEAMTTADQQLAFAKAFGVMPSGSRPRTHYVQAVPDRQGVRRRRGVRPGPGQRRRRWTSVWPTSTPGLPGSSPARRTRRRIAGQAAEERRTVPGASTEAGGA